MKKSVLKRMSIIDIPAAENLNGVNIFVDTNVLIFVDGAHSFDEKEKAYSNAYFKLIKNNNMFTSEKCLGEFYNRLAKLYFRLDQENDPSIVDFKKYRKSAEFSTSMQCIYDATRDFISDLNVIKSYEHVDIDKAFDSARTGLIDYADIISARICLKEDMYFFSDDGDSIYCKDLKIISNNKWMLSKVEKRHSLACL
ncbi:hypothetical protein [Shinella sp. JR1-6]|uniref:hypothetical protein n=1 Tax=Shinella sp. JR1-6 TaxID=2527671 RepID=UPI00102D5BC5|nr:hypothetical protein [Shinella sp. JR1-6]TAA52173.1 hypothetical protein EXZ48_30330 [Shinella sp. JR1-6]